MTDKRKFSYRIVLFLLPMVAFMVVLFVRPFNKDFAYHFLRNECEGQSSWIYNRIFVNPQPVDIAFVGTSVTMNGLSEQMIEDRLLSAGKRYNIINIGYCRHGRNMDNTILKDLFKNKRPEKIFIEVHEIEDRFGHIDFGYVADAEDVLMPEMVVNHDLHRDMFHGLTVRFEDLKSNLFNRQVKDTVPGSAHSYTNSLQVMSASELEEQRKEYEERYKDKISDGRTINERFSLSYLDKMVALAKKNGCKVYFIYFPIFRSELGMKNRDYYERNGELLLPPMDIFREPANFKDIHHLNDRGAAKLSAWLAGVIAKQ